MRKLPAICGIIICVIMISCGQSYDEKQRQSKIERDRLRSEDSLSLKVGVLPTLDCLPIYLAEDYHLFDTTGVTVHLRECNAAMDCDTALAGGSVEGMVTDLIRAERLRHEGTPMTYVTATNAYWQLISNRAARVKEIRQLSDKMLAMTRYSATDYLANVAVDSAKPKFDVYRIQINDVRLRLKMLLNNEMDAVLLPEPQATEARLYGNPMLMDSREKGFRFGAIAFNARKVADKYRQKQLSAFVKAYNMACDSLNRNGLKTYSRLLEKYYKIDEKTINALPRMRFDHASQPRAKDISMARKAQPT